MYRIVVSLREKRSTATQYENASVGVDIEASGLELNSPQAILDKSRELFAIARSSVQQQLLDVVPEHGQPRSENGNGHANGNGYQNGNGNGEHKNGNGRSYGRPTPEPTPKQKVLLQKLAKERNLSPEKVGEISKRELGRPVPQLDKHGMSKLIEILMAQVAS